MPRTSSGIGLSRYPPRSQSSGCYALPRSCGEKQRCLRHRSRKGDSGKGTSSRRYCGERAILWIEEDQPRISVARAARIKEIVGGLGGVNSISRSQDIRQSQLKLPCSPAPSGKDRVLRIPRTPLFFLLSHTCLRGGALDLTRSQDVRCLWMWVSLG